MITDGSLLTGEANSFIKNGPFVCFEKKEAAEVGDKNPNKLKKKKKAVVKITDPTTVTKETTEKKKHKNKD